jgi:hypothetical protein
MRFATLVGLFFSALSVSAQSSLSDPTTSELLGELAQLPKCAVRPRTAEGFIIHLRYKANDRYRPHAWHHHCPSRVVPSVISTAFVPTRSTSQPARNASSPAVQSKKPCVRPDFVVVLYNLLADSSTSGSKMAAKSMQSAIP